MRIKPQREKSCEQGNSAKKLIQEYIGDLERQWDTGFLSHSLPFHLLFRASYIQIKELSAIIWCSCRRPQVCDNKTGTFNAILIPDSSLMLLILPFLSSFSHPRFPPKCEWGGLNQTVNYASSYYVLANQDGNEKLAVKQGSFPQYPGKYQD